MLRGELTAGFPFGVLQITDDASTERSPAWRSRKELVTAAGTALVMRVRHRDEGDVHVSVWDRPEGGEGALAHRGELEVPSGVLRICDALEVDVLRVPVQGSRQRIEIYADAMTEPTAVRVVMTPAG